MKCAVKDQAYALCATFSLAATAHVFFRNFTSALQQQILRAQMHLPLDQNPLAWHPPARDLRMHFPQCIL
jgi:hypothetical protein